MSSVDGRLLMKRHRALIAVGLSLIAASAWAKPPIHEGQAFIAARQALLKNRWRPMPIHTRAGQATEGVEKRLSKLGIHEFDALTDDERQELGEWANVRVASKNEPQDNIGGNAEAQA